MKISEAISRIDERFPTNIQEDYDNSGSQVVFPEETLYGVYICLDADSTTIADAVKNRCNLIISHHPMIFRAVKKINSSESGGKSIINLIDNRVSLYSLHTNFDKIMFSYLSEISGFSNSELLIKKGILNDNEIGFGSIVVLDQPVSFKSLIEKIKKALCLDYLIITGDLDTEISKAAFINGSGGGSIEKIISISGPDCIITGDVGYHHAKFALENNVCIIDAGHYGTEIIFKKLLAESVNDIINVENSGINIVISEIEKNPFKIY